MDSRSNRDRILYSVSKLCGDDESDQPADKPSTCTGGDCLPSKSCWEESLNKSVHMKNVICGPSTSFIDSSGCSKHDDYSTQELEQRRNPAKCPDAEADNNKDKEIKRILIGGLHVEFPCSPYPAQLGMMSQIIQALKNADNCLLESPTGTGKTLALLSSCLAWRKNEKELLEQLVIAQIENVEKSSPAKKQEDKTKKWSPTLEPESTAQANNSESDTDSDADVFKSPKHKKQKVTKEMPIEKPFDVSDSSVDSFVIEPDIEKWNAYESIRMNAKRAPTIFYGTRTHKQVEQVIDQLRKTSYTDGLRMSVLGSREHTCINPNVRNRPNMNDMCQNLINHSMGGGCSFYHMHRSITHEKLEMGKHPPVFDIEDMVSISRKRGACPYFVLRNLAEKSDIVFCPYSYLVDPSVRDSMNINLKNAIVIMDEAHNIEDTCREAGSLLLQQTTLDEAIKEAKENIKRNMNAAEYNVIEDFFQSLHDWLEKYGPTLTYSDDQSVTSWSGADLINLLDLEGITKEKFNSVKEAVSQINNMKLENPNDSNGLYGVIQMLTGSILLCFGYLYDLNNTDKYEAFLIRKVVELQPKPGIWLSKLRGGERVWCYSLKLLCLSPSIVFNEMLVARTIVLASGTLSPLASFSAELGTKFPKILKGRHVVPSDNLFVSIISKGPNGVTLRGVFNNISQYAYQDELGQVILQTAKIVPHGVLVFLPSYNLIEKLRTRWDSTGLMCDLNDVKNIFFEPREKDKMNSIMEKYNTAIMESERCNRGAIMFGVFRGKIAEGIDFNDDHARVVMAVGIPFLNRNNMEINLKMKFNDKNKQEITLSGNEWYKIQAYRALNQAIGRGIRHKNDWGAIILVDCRFLEDYAIKSLPSWIAQQIKSCPSWESYLVKTADFCERMRKKHGQSDV